MTISRFTLLLIIVFIGLFFKIERVTRNVYDRTYISPVALPVVGFDLLVPVGLACKLWYDAFQLVWELVALYCLVSRVRYGVRVNGTRAAGRTGRLPPPQRRGTEEKRRR